MPGYPTLTGDVGGPGSVPNRLLFSPCLVLPRSASAHDIAPYIIPPKLVPTTAHGMVVCEHSPCIYTMQMVGGFYS